MIHGGDPGQFPSTFANIPQAPIQLNSLTGTYATSAYIAALKQSSSELEKLASDVAAFDKTIKSDAKVQALIGESAAPSRAIYL